METGFLTFIFVNSRLSGDRLRFTIAHELGHIIMQNEDVPYPRCDEEANEFCCRIYASRQRGLF